VVGIGEQALDEAMAAADAILAVLARAGLGKPVLLHGLDATVRPFVERAARRGFSARVGPEDGPALPDGTAAPSNVPFARRAGSPKPRGRTIAEAGFRPAPRFRRARLEQQHARQPGP
jgi:uncharacterized protein (DUF849 family)